MVRSPQPVCTVVEGVVGSIAAGTVRLIVLMMRVSVMRLVRRQGGSGRRGRRHSQ
jgi:hypothetical protein